MSRPIEVGQHVRCFVTGRRSFEATVLAVREPDVPEAEAAVDVTDPRNGGRRTLRADQVRRIRKLRAPVRVEPVVRIRPAPRRRP